MNRQTLADEAARVARNAKHNLRWIRKNPEKIDPAKREDMEAYLKRMIKFAKAEKKNARRADRTSLRRLRNLVALMIPHNTLSGKR